MLELQTFLSVKERDVDLLLLEEAHVSPNFTNWLVTRITGLPSKVSLVGAWHSVTDSHLGESDLVIVYTAEDESHQAILLENKIDAQPQFEQSLRYQQRGQKGIENGSWVDFKSCLVAPKKYLDSDSEVYDAKISYEELMAFFVAADDARSRYKAQFIKGAIDKQKRGYQSTISDEMTSFAQAYLSYVSLNYPELNPEASKPRAAGNSWIRFYPNKTDKQTQIIHQIFGNVVKVMMLGQADRYDEVCDKLSSLDIPDLTVQVSGKSLTIEKSVPEIDPLTQMFDEVVEQINQSINVACYLKEKLEAVSL
ncbi:PD-(D/E)XK nuclease superfamily protein [Vibrio sonorensis]|uniref:PD-(D/E)XK nuclease superfamily protein n=1 Tax=Vibrio sonorensis TaxID=1004316 RepID=UPI0008DB247F|nr:PD-(D/E)XK nuclease superfamily protein [Vibrio sonorensis]